MNPVYRWFVVVVLALLAACAGTGSVAPPAPEFELAGRVSARHQERVFTSALRWKQQGGSDEIWLNTPLGQTLAYLKADASGATLTGADQKQYRASSIESLTRSALGWRLPVTGLRFWVLGQSVPGGEKSVLERDDAGRIARLQQDDLQVSFTYPEGKAQRPSRLEVSGDAAEIRLVIDSLTTPQP